MCYINKSLRGSTTQPIQYLSVTLPKFIPSLLLFSPFFPHYQIHSLIPLTNLSWYAISLSIYIYIYIYLPFLFCSCVEHCDGNLQEKRVETFDLHIHILFIGVVFSVLRLYIYLNSQFVPLLIVSST